MQIIIFPCYSANNTELEPKHVFYLLPMFKLMSVVVTVNRYPGTVGQRYANILTSSVLKCNGNGTVPYCCQVGFLKVELDTPH
jgi:hypothetical protein